jgi:hypothetical protein
MRDHSVEDHESCGASRQLGSSCEQDVDARGREAQKGEWRQRPERHRVKLNWGENPEGRQGNKESRVGEQE